MQDAIADRLRQGLGRMVREVAADLDETGLCGLDLAQSSFQSRLTPAAGGQRLNPQALARLPALWTVAGGISACQPSASLRQRYKAQARFTVIVGDRLQADHGYAGAGVWQLVYAVRRLLSAQDFGLAVSPLMPEQVRPLGQAQRDGQPWTWWLATSPAIGWTRRWTTATGRRRRARPIPTKCSPASAAVLKAPPPNGAALAWTTAWTASRASRPRTWSSSRHPPDFSSIPPRRPAQLFNRINQEPIFYGQPQHQLRPDPASIRKPGKYFEFNTKLAVRTLPGNPQRVLVIGQRFADAAQPALAALDVFSDEQAAQAFGRGSYAHLLARAAINANPICNSA